MPLFQLYLDPPRSVELRLFIGVEPLFTYFEGVEVVLKTLQPKIPIPKPKAPEP